MGRNSPRNMSGAEFRRARKAMGLSATEMAKLLWMPDGAHVRRLERCSHVNHAQDLLIRTMIKHPKYLELLRDMARELEMEGAREKLEPVTLDLAGSLGAGFSKSTSRTF